MPKVTKPLTDTDVRYVKYTSKEEYKEILIKFENKLLQKYKDSNSELYKEAYKEKKPKLKNKLSDGKGLYLIVKENGTKSWQFDYVYLNKRLSMSFGIYPEISLKKARELREYSRKLLLDGINPIEEKRNKNQKTNITTFKDVADKWIASMVENSWKSEFTSKRNIRRIEKHLYPSLEKKEFETITRIDILEIFNKLIKNKNFETVHKLFGFVDRIWNHAVLYKHCEYNIITAIDKRVLIPERDVQNMKTLLEENEIKQLLIDIDNYEENFNSDISVIYALKLAPYVILRPFNLRHLEWSEINFDKEYIYINAGKMKTKKDFIMPLTQKAIDILKSIEPYSKHKSKYVFPSPMSNFKVLSDGTINQAFQRMGYNNKQTLHGFRGMFSTIAHNNIMEHRIYSDIIESCLSHVETNKVKAAYNREDAYKYLDEKREVMNWWSEYLKLPCGKS